MTRRQSAARFSQTMDAGFFHERACGLRSGRKRNGGVRGGGRRGESWSEEWPFSTDDTFHLLKIRASPAPPLFLPRYSSFLSPTLFSLLLLFSFFFFLSPCSHILEKVISILEPPRANGKRHQKFLLPPPCLSLPRLDSIPFDVSEIAFR